VKIKIYYDKVGERTIPVTVSLYSVGEIFYSEQHLVTSPGVMEFDCTFPTGTDCLLDFTVTDTIANDYITITQMSFDGFWDLKTQCLHGTKITDTHESFHNSIFYAGTLRYEISRPIVDWAVR
jgi:hypothetical protein